MGLSSAVVLSLLSLGRRVRCRGIVVTFLTALLTVPLQETVDQDCLSCGFWVAGRRWVAWVGV